MRDFFTRLGRKLRSPASSPRGSADVAESSESPRPAMPPALPPAAAKLPVSGRTAASLALCLAYLSEMALHTEGIYRVPGASRAVGELSGAICGGDVARTLEILSSARAAGDDDSSHLVACAVKRVLRTHEPLLSYDLFDAFVRAALQASADASAGGGAEGGADAGTSTSLAEMRSCVERLPAFSCALLWVLFQHIRDVVACEEDNRMSMQNVLITLGINISRSRRGAPNISPLRLMIEDPSIFEGVPLPLGEERAGEVDEALRLDLVCVAAGDSGSKPWWRAVSEVWMRYAGIAVPDDGGGGGAADEDD